MATIAENRKTWDGTYTWDTGGEEWAEPWGTSSVQWSASLAPRLQTFLPARLVVEVAPGAGRWTGFLLEQCDEYVGIDLSERCVERCRERFRAESRARFEVTDGRSLPTISDRSVDLCFSFDSLVHADPDVLSSYIGELARVLTDDGVAFIHHSNRGGLSLERSRAADRVSWRIDQLRRFTLRNQAVSSAIRRVTSPSLRQRVWRTGWRSETMSAIAFEHMAATAGLRCVGQELISWAGTHRLIDCISIVARPGSRWDRANVVVRNQEFVDEAVSAGARDSVFGTLARLAHERRR